VIGGEDGDYVLRVKGDSMKDAGILEGDYVVVKSSADADDGTIVVALIEDEATVKRFFRDEDRIRLEPANKSYKPIKTREAELLGKVVGVFRSV
jgi:repressor LexA